MILAKFALTLSIAALAGSAGGQILPAAPDIQGDPAVELFSEHGVENAALLYYRYWLTGESKIGAPNEDTNMNPDGSPTEAFKEELKAGQETIRGYLKASRIEHADWGVEYEKGIGALLPHLGKLRYTARVLSTDAERLLEEGEVEQAAERVAAIFRMGEQLSTDRILISSLVGMSMETLAITTVEEILASERLTHEAREIILEAMDAIDLDNPTGVRGAVLGERDIFLRWAIRRYTGPTAGADFVKEMFAYLDGSFTKQPPWTKKVSDYDEAQLQSDIQRAEKYYDDVLSIWDLPDAGDRIDQLALLIENGHYGVAGRRLLPAIGKVWDSAQRIRRELIETRKLLENAPVVAKEDQSEDDD